MRVIGNILWFLLAGWSLFLGYLLAAIICFILIVTIPFGVASLRIGVFCLWPFGRTVVHDPNAGAASAIGNVIWIVLCGWWLVLADLIVGVVLCITIIGIPLGIGAFKLIPVSFMPFGKEIVPIEHARARGGEYVAVGR